MTSKNSGRIFSAIVWALCLSQLKTPYLLTYSAAAAEPAPVLIPPGDFDSFQEFLTSSLEAQKSNLQKVQETIEEVRADIRRAEKRVKNGKVVSVVSFSASGGALVWTLTRALRKSAKPKALLLALAAVTGTLGLSERKLISLDERQKNNLEAVLVEIEEHARQLEAQIRVLEQLESGESFLERNKQIRTFLRGSFEEKQQIIADLQRTIVRVQNDLSAEIEKANSASGRKSLWITVGGSGALSAFLGSWILSRSNSPTVTRYSKFGLILGSLALLTGFGGGTWDARTLLISREQTHFLQRELTRLNQELLKTLEEFDVIQRLSNPQ